MKRCPECDSSFPDTDKFCEFDGTTLVADYSDGASELSPSPGGRNRQTGSDPGEMGAGSYPTSREGSSQGNWKTLAIIGVAGMALGVVLFVVYQRMTSEPPAQSSNEPTANQAVVEPPAPLMSLPPSISVSPSPSPEPSPSPSTPPSPAAPAAPAPVTLSSGALSTGSDDKATRGQFTIRLTNGTSVEAEEVWETGEGIWYRRRGIVTLLQRNEVKAIEKPSPSTPLPSPTATPL